MEQIIYTTSSCDEKHLNELKVFLYSMWKHGNRYPVALDLVNCDDFKIVRDIEKIYPRIENIRHIKIENTDEMIVVNRNGGTIPVFNLKVMYTRPLGLKNILNEFPNSMVLSIDTDIIVRGGMSGIWDGVKPGVLKVWDKGKEKSDRIRFQGGVMVYGNSPEIREYYGAVLRSIGDSRKFQSAQEAIFRAWWQERERIKKIDLPIRYNDSKLSEESIIWHCKHSHFEKEKYQTEFKAYLKEATIE